MNKKLRMSRQQ